MSSYQYRKSHCGDKTVVRSSYLYYGISFTGKMSSLYWNGVQGDGSFIKIVSYQNRMVSKPFYLCNLHIKEDSFYIEMGSSGPGFGVSYIRDFMVHSYLFFVTYISGITYWECCVVKPLVSCTDLTDTGRVTHICVSKLTIIGSDNGLLPGRRQAIIWTNAGIFLIRTLGTNVSEILGKIHSFSFKKIHLKMLSVKGCLFSLSLNELKEEYLWGGTWY